MTDKKEWLRRRNEDAKQAHAALMKFYPLDLEYLDGEEWLPVPDYEDYQVSNFGRVKSLKGRWDKIPRIMKPVLILEYMYIKLCKAGKSKIFRIHRLVAQCFIPNPSGKREVNHHDGHKLNNHVSNLEWVTQSENVQHAYATGLTPQGEDNYQAKLTNEQICYVRENPDGLNARQLAEMFRVSKSRISAIQLGKTYKTAGGAVRDKIDKRIPDEVRSQIRAEYKAGVHGCGSSALAKKYGVGKTTILRIIKGK